MNRRSFFTALGITLVSPKILTKVAKATPAVSMSPLLDQLNKGLVSITSATPVYYSRGIYNFIKENTHTPKSETYFMKDEQDDLNKWFEQMLKFPK